MTRAAAAGTAALVAALTLAASLLAWQSDSPLVPRDGGLPSGRTAPLFLVLLAVAYAAYLWALWLVRRRGGSLRATLVLAAAIQLAPLAGPLLLSTDAWTYWSYGWLGAHGTNPYDEPPASRPDNPALPFMGADWRTTTTVYGPVFTLASEPVARIAGDDEDAAAWIAKALGACAVLVSAAVAARLARRRALAAALVGWNPLLAVHAGGGGHNDALLGALLVAALALGRSRRLVGAGAAWAFAVLVKWVPLPLLGLELLSPATPGRRRLAASTGVGLALLATLATWRYGGGWLGAAGPLAHNAARQTRYALPARLEQLGVPHALSLALAALALAVMLLALAREALRGRARHAAAACALLVTTPYLAAWYLLWAVPLAAADDDDRLARGCCLVLGAYLLPQGIPV